MPLIESAIGGIAVSILDRAIKAGQYVVKEGKGAYNKTQHVQAVMAASDAYVDNYHNRHCQVKVLPGLTKDPLDLESIYTDVELLDEESIGLFVGHDELKKTYKAKGKRSFSVTEAKRIRGMKIANEKQFLMILGGPGIGKSTFLRKIGLEALKKDGEIKRDCVPVFLALQKFSEDRIDIHEKLVKEFTDCKFPAAEAFVDSALEQGKLLVLFDGLDEVPSRNLNSVIEKIEDFVDKYDKNSFVASCRIAAYKSSFRRFTDITIAEFNDDQIQQFIDRWFSSEEDKALETAKNYWALLSQDEHKATKELAQTPLLLTFLCLIYDREQELPPKRSSLYDKALKIILSEWSAQKRLERDPIYKGLYSELEVLMLAKIAYDSFEQDQLFFSRNAVTQKISVFLSDTLDAPEYLDADKVLDAIEVQQGILVERATDAYSFSHLTLQEYLVATYITKKQLESNLAAHHLTDESWREVFLLVASLMESRVSELLLAMHRHAQTYILQYPKVQRLVEWSNVNKDRSCELYQRVAMLEIGISIGIAKTIHANVINTNRVIVSKAKAINEFITSTSSIINARASASDSANAISGTRVANFASQVADVIASSGDGGAEADRIVASAKDSDIGKAINSARASAIDSANNHHFFKASSLNALADKLTEHRRTLPGVGAGHKAWRDWPNRLQLIWLEALGLDIDAVTFSSEEAIALKNYLYANELLIRGKESAIGLSRIDWEALEEKLLTLD